MTRTEPSTDMASFRKTLSTSKRIIAVAGAGLSAASGIPTFRGAGGLWRRFNATDLATPEAFEDNPNKVWQFYHYRRETVKKASVNNAHIALAEFSLQKTRDRLMPGNAGSTFTLITQNIDGLSRAALTDLDANTSAQSEPIHNNASEQPPLLEMHGRLFDVICTEHDRDHTTHNDKSPICPALLNTEVNSIDTKNEKQIPVSDLPRCETCGALARPGVVWFGEMPLYMDVIDSLVREAELCIVVGTSSTVYPAAGYAHSVKRRGGKVAVFNLERSSGDREADFLFFGACEETLPQALGL